MLSIYMGAAAVEGSEVEVDSDHTMVVAPDLFVGPADGAQQSVYSSAHMTESRIPADGKKAKQQRWTRHSGAEGKEQWARVRELGEVEMKAYVEEWCRDVQRMADVDVEASWLRYRI